MTSSQPSFARGQNLVLLFAGILWMGGCLWTTRGQGSDLQGQISQQDERLATIEASIEAQRQELVLDVRREVDRAEEKMRELENVLQQATQVVTRNSADLGLEVQNLRNELARIEGTIAELSNVQAQLNTRLGEFSHRLVRIADQAGLDLPIDPGEIPDDQAEHFTEGYKALQAKAYSKSRGLFREYVQRYPRDEQADNAHYWIGKSYLIQNNPSKALASFRTIITDYAAGDAADEALLDMGHAFLTLKACGDARDAWTALLHAHADSPLVSRAQTQLRELDRRPSSRCQ